MSDGAARAEAYLPNAADSERPILGNSDLAGRIRAYDWSKNSLGPPETWPKSLRTAVGIMLTSRQPIWIGWGRELIYFYNDPYKSIIGGKHPWALGRPTSEVWREIWNDIGPMLDTAMSGDHERLLAGGCDGYISKPIVIDDFLKIVGEMTAG